MSERGIAPVTGVALLTVVVVALAGVVVTVIPANPGANPAVFDVSMTVEPTEEDRWKVTLIHEGGEPIDLEGIDISLHVDGVALTHQPSLPLGSQRGYYGFGGAAFNTETDNDWSPGERGWFVVAGTNDPDIDPDSRVTARLVRDGHTLVETSAIASG